MTAYSSAYKFPLTSNVYTVMEHWCSDVYRIPNTYLCIYYIVYFEMYVLIYLDFAINIS